MRAKKNTIKKKIFFFFLFFFISINSYLKASENCVALNSTNKPCIVISKTPNTSYFNQEAINRTIITREEIANSGAIDINDILKLITGIDVFQSGSRGQQTSVFMRGSNSNHTLVLLNGIAINDSSAPNGLHDFGQDFIQTIEQIEIYKGSSGAHFGNGAIAGAINFVTNVDYINSLTLKGSNSNNNSVESNFTKILKDKSILNLKVATNQNKTVSAIANGFEKDGSKNYQINFNSEKFINDNLKFKSTLYSRKTKSDYDNNSTDELGYYSNNKMYALQNNLEYKSKNSESNLILHYHNYDRNYYEKSFLDEYYSSSINAKASSSVQLNDKFSFGYGSEYKYDKAEFENRGDYNASAKGYLENYSFFSNLGYKINKNQIFSTFIRSERNNIVGTNQTYKLNFLQNFNSLKFGITQATGLKNPSLYELYGRDNYGIEGNINLKPEKSKTNEIYGEYTFSKNIKFTATAYKTKILNSIDPNEAYTRYENQPTHLNQKGIENIFFLKKNNQSISLFSNISKSTKSNGQVQTRRPDLSYGFNYSQKFKMEIIGPFNLQINYKYTGEYIDWNGQKNSKQKDVDLINLSFTKDFLDKQIFFNITNLLNEKYQKPATYSQDERIFQIGYKHKF